MKAPAGIITTGNSVTLQYHCPFCGEMTEIDIPKEKLPQLYGYLTGDILVQNAFPEMDADTREVMVSGLCLNCQAKVFGEEQEDGQE